MSLARVDGFQGNDIEIGQNDIILLRGPNGSGKTSLLRALAGLDGPLRPRAIERRAPVAYGPQDARDGLIGLTVAGEFRLRARALPARLAPLAARASTTLSAGEARRVVHASCAGAPLLLLDEPSEGLDDEGRSALRAMILAAAREGAVVMADHGDALADLATREVVLGESPSAPLTPPPPVDGAPILVAGAWSARGRRLPALALGPGFHALRGPNGGGKSTLLSSLAGLVERRDVRIEGAPPDPGRNVRLLVQHAGDLLTRERVADECAPSALIPPSLAERHPLTLSGGEAQRVALAKTLGANAPVYLLDEPEAHLDGAGRVLLAEAIAERVKRGACVLAATHDIAFLSLAHTLIEVPA